MNTARTKNLRYFVSAPEDKVYESGIELGTPVEYFPDTRELVALPEANGLNQWIIFATADWAIDMKKTHKIAVIKIEDADYEDVRRDRAILSVDCAGKIFNSNMQDTFDRIMINIR